MTLFMMWGGLSTLNIPSAQADTYTRVYHRTYSQIPTVRIWDTTQGSSLTQTRDVSRGETCCGANTGFDANMIYVPQNWCAEVNIYWDNSFVDQWILRGGAFWYLREHYYHSVYIFNPGADGVCD